MALGLPVYDDGLCALGLFSSSYRQADVTITQCPPKAPSTNCYLRTYAPKDRVEVRTGAAKIYSSLKQKSKLNDFRHKIKVYFFLRTAIVVRG